MNLPRLKEQRERRGLSQQALSDLADVSRDSISAYERGVRNAHPGTAKKLANALEVDVKNLTDMEKQEVEISWEDHNDRIHAEKLRFTGEKLAVYEDGRFSYILYESPGGYRVYVDDMEDHGAWLHPNSGNDPTPTGEPEYGVYTAEELVGEYPAFGSDVGVLRVRDLD